MLCTLLNYTKDERATGEIRRINDACMGFPLPENDYRCGKLVKALASSFCSHAIDIGVVKERYFSTAGAVKESEEIIAFPRQEMSS